MITSEFIEKIRIVVSEKLGREAVVRKINNRDQYFILDLAFSYFQKADRNRRNDYRSGYLYLQKDGANQLLFVIAHSPLMIDFFSKNFDFVRFREIIIQTAIFRNSHFLRFAKSSENKNVVEKQNLSDFIDLLNQIESRNFVRQVFTKSTSKDSKNGNIFITKIANSFDIKDIDAIIEESWDLFMWLYPSKPIFKRNASLNRSLLKIQRQCEIDRIRGVPLEITEKKCFGQIEGAHIISYKNGGSDKLENGLWLCNLHHRLTEGKLEGKRDLKTISVKYMDNK